MTKILITFSLVALSLCFFLGFNDNSPLVQSNLGDEQNFPKSKINSQFSEGYSKYPPPVNTVREENKQEALTEDIDPVDEQINHWKYLEENKYEISRNLLNESDLDGNELLSPDELSASDDYFKSMDLDGDGYLNRSEIEKRIHISKSKRLKAIKEEKQFVSNYFTQLDKNKDTTVSIDEIPKGDSFLEAYDLDKDGYISQEEQEVVLRRIAPEKVIAYLSE